MRKKLLALLLAAALALGLLAGCGGGKSQSLSQMLLNLLDGQYQNVSVEIDSDLEAKLRQAIRKAEAENAGDDAAVIRAALETALGSTITFRYLGNGQKGETAFDLVFYAGSDPDKAAQAAYSQWNPILSNVPDDGKYDTSLAMVETNSGVWMLVKATVEKAGTVDKPEPATVTGISVSTQPKKTQYNKGEPFDPAGMVVTVHYSDGSTKKIENITSSGSQGVTWSPANINADTTVTITYGGKTDTVAVKLITLDRIEVSGNYQKEYTVGDSFNPAGMEVTAVYSNGHKEPITDDYTIKIGNDTITSGDTFGTAGTYSLTVTYDNLTSDPVNIHVADQNGYHEEGGTYVVTGSNGLQNLFSAHIAEAAGADITLETDQTLTGTEPLADTFTGTLNGNGNTITMKGNRSQGLFNTIEITGLVQNVDIEVNGTISNPGGTIGAVAGTNNGEISGCTVTGGTIQATGNVSYAYAGGVVGWNNEGKISGCTVTGGTIQATGNVSYAYAGGVVGWNNEGKISGCTVTGGAITAITTTDASGAYAGGIAGYNRNGTIGTAEAPCTVDGTIVSVNGSSNAYAGIMIGYDEKTNAPVNKQ